MIELHPNQNKVFIESLLPSSDKAQILRALQKDTYSTGFIVGVIEYLEPDTKGRIDLGQEIFGEDWTNFLSKIKIDDNYLDGMFNAQPCCAYRFDDSYNLGPDCKYFDKAVEAAMTAEREATCRFPSRDAVAYKRRVQLAKSGYFQIYFKDHMVILLRFFTALDVFEEKITDSFTSAS